MKKKLFLFGLFLITIGVIAAVSPVTFPLLKAFLQSNLDANSYLGTNFGGISIKSNTLVSIPALARGDNYLWSSNGVPYVISSDPSGTLATNQYNAATGGGGGVTSAELISATNNALALATNNDAVVSNALFNFAHQQTNGFDTIVDVTAKLVSATNNALALAANNDTVVSNALNVNVTAATNQLAIANTNLWDPLNSSVNSTNTARLAVNLASTFDALGAAQNATNTARLAINLASAFDALNAALNSTNGITAAWIQGKFPGLIVTNGETQVITVSNQWQVDASHQFVASNLTSSRVLVSRTDSGITNVASGAVPIDGDGTATTFAQVAALGPFLTNNETVATVFSNTVKIDITHTLSLSNLTAGALIRAGADETVVSGDLSGDVTTSGALATTLKSTGTAGTYYKTTFDGQGRETSGVTTVAMADIVQPGTILTNNYASGNSAILLSNAVKLDVAHTLSLSNLTAGALVKAGADNTLVSGDLSGDITTSGALATTLKSTGTAGTYYKTTFDGQGRETSGVTTVAMGDIVQPGTIITNNYASGNSGILLSNSVKLDIAHSLSLSNLTASRVVLSGADDSLASAAASGAVPIDADGSATTAAQINTILAGTSPNINGTAITNNIVSKAANYTLATTDYILLMNGSLAATLPTAVGAQGKMYLIKCVTSGTNAILTTSAQTIDGAAKWTNTAINKFTWVVSDNANWRVIGQN